MGCDAHEGTVHAGRPGPLWFMTRLALPVLLVGWAGAAEAQRVLELPPDIASAVDTQTGISAGTALLNTCVTGRNEGRQFQDDCNAIFGEQDPDRAANAINQVAADQVATQNNAANRQFRTTMGAIGSRMTQLRLASAPGLSVDPTGLAWSGQLDGATGGAAGADDAFGRLGAFASLRYRWGDEDQTGFQPGLDFDGWSAAAGLDYRFSPNLVAGAALNYTSDEIDYDGNRGDMSADSWGLSGFGTMYLENGFFLDGVIGYNWGDYDLSRNLSYSTGSQVVSQAARSSTDSRMFTVSAGGGYTLASGPVSITPMARIDYIRNKVDGFSEQMTDPGADGGGMAIAMDSATYESLTSRLGAQVSRAVSHSRGVVVPSARLDWVHEFDNDQQQVPGRFIGDVQPGGTPFFVVTNNPDRNYFDLEFSLAAQFAHGRSLFVSYNTLLGLDDVSYHGVNAGLRVEF
jgi:outer membrane lipase/esterase